MPTRLSRKPKPAAVQAAELALAVPQVVAHRMARMALAGHSPSARDQREFQMMSDEKTAAFNESWGAMAVAALHANQRLATSVVTTVLFPWSKYSATPDVLASQYHEAAMGVLDKGMAPVHRRAVANAKRLNKTKLK
jgi:hypothetical protein